MKVIPDISGLKAAIYQHVFARHGQGKSISATGICDVIDSFTVEADLVKREDVREKLLHCIAEEKMIRALPAWDGK